jgi:hypothetical protein
VREQEPSCCMPLCWTCKRAGHERALCALWRFNLEAWNRLAELAATELQKGNQVQVCCCRIGLASLHARRDLAWQCAEAMAAALRRWWAG